MRILYVSSETPATPAGGIATYLQYIVPAMEAAGHETFLFTWPKDAAQPVHLDRSPFKPANVWFGRGADVRARALYPGAHPNHSTAFFLLPELQRCIDAWDIDVVEATDFMAPALFLYQQMRTTRSRRLHLCVTYYHGFVEDFYDADSLQPPPDKLRDLTGERQQCRISDLVIAPSLAAASRLQTHGIDVPVTVVREPYRFSAGLCPETLRPAISYMGRISLSKGADAMIYLANAIDEVAPLEYLLLIGTEVPTPFRVVRMQDYLRARLSPSLRGKLRCTGYLPRDQALELLRPGDIAPHLGYADTFSYACVESIDRGLLPIVRAGSPMAEFVPPELADIVFPERLGSAPGIQARFLRLQADAPRIARTLTDFNRAALDPERIAESMAAAYDAALTRKSGRVQVAVCRSAGRDDVTVLIPAYRPGEVFSETVDALAAQTLGSPRVIICDDGTPEAERGWFDYARLRLPDCRIIRQPNGGLLAARNALIAALDTPLAVFIDADDLLDPGYLQRVLQAWNLALDPPQAVLTQRWNFDEGSEHVMANLLGDYAHLLLNDFRMTALIEAKVLRELGFDPLRRNGEADDWDFWLRFVAAGFRAEMVPEPLFRYRFRAGSMSWPWSQGQSMGTNVMLTECVSALLARRPGWIPLVARALSRARAIE
jgi:hypothetical protein